MPAQTIEEVKRILHMEVRYEDAINKLGEYHHVIEDITKQMKELKKQMQSGNWSASEVKKAQSHYAALDTQLRVVKKDSQELMKSVQNEIKLHREQDNSLRSLRAQLSNLTKEFDSLSDAARRGTEGLMKMKQINEITTKIKDAEAATQRFYRNVGNYQSALQGLEQLKIGFSNLGSTISGVLGGMGLGAFTNKMIETSRDFEDSIARVRAVANPLFGDFQRMRDTALELGRTTRYTSGEVARGMEELARKGLSAQQVIDSINPTLHLAQANMVSIADAAQISSSAMRAFGLDSKDLAYINDQLSTACANSASTLGLLGEAMKTAGPVANVANISLSETTAMISTLANVGMTGSDAGTGIKQIILALSTANRSKKGLEVLKKYNIELNETRIRTEGLIPILKEMKKSGLGANVTDLKELTGKYASPRIANLIQNIDTADKLNEKLRTGVGENDRMFEQSLGTLSKSIYNVQSAWQNMMVELSADTSSFVTGPLDVLTKALRFLADNIGLISSSFVSILSAVTFTPLIKGVAAATTSTKNKLFKDLVETRARLNADLEDAVAKYAKAKETETWMHRQAKEGEIKLEEVTSEKRRLIEERELIRRRRHILQMSGVNSTGVNSLLAAEQRYSTQIAEIERQRVRLYQETEEAKTLATEAGNKTRIALERKTLAEEKLLASKNIGLWQKAKIGIAGVATAFKNLWKTIRTFAWIAIFTEVIQLTTQWWERVHRVEERLSELDTKLEEINSGQLEAVKRIEAYKKRIEDLQKIQNKTAKQQDEYNRLLKTAWGMVSSQVKEHSNIITALNEQIRLVKELNRVRAHMDLINEQSNEALKTGKKMGLEGVTLSTPDDVINTLDKMWVDYQTDVYGNKRTAESIHEDTRYNELIQKLKSSFGYADKKTSFVFDEKTKALSVQYDTFSKEDIEYAKEILHEIKSLFPVNRTIMGKTGDLFDNIETVLGSFMQITEQNQIDSVLTDLGDFQQSPDWSGKGGKEREFDPLAYLQNLLKKYSAEFNSLVAETTLDVIDKQRKEIDNALKSLQGDIYKIIGGEVDGKKYDPVPQWKRAAAKYPKLAAQVTEMMGKAIEQATVRMQMRIDQLDYQANERTLKIEKEGWDARIALAKAKLQEYFLVTRGNVQQVANNTLEQQEKEYQAGEVNAAIAFNLEKQNKEKELVTSGLVRDSEGNELKTRATVLKAYEAYVKRRTEIEDELQEDLDTDRDLELQNELLKLNEQNKALAHYYDQRTLMEARYEQERLNRKKNFDKQQLETTKKFYDEETRLIVQGMKNELEQMMLGYDMQTNANRAYLTSAQFGTEKYWNDLEWRIGERAAKTYQMEYDIANKEVERMKDLRAKGLITEEDYTAKVIQLEKNKENVITNVNETIIKTDEERFQAASEITGGMSQLTQAMIDDESEQAHAAKAFAIMEAFINLGLSISRLMAQESKAGVIGIATTAAGVASIMAQFATIITTIKSASAEGYATGGKVMGPGTGTSDSIPANLSNGEFVMTAKATKLFEPLLMAMNGIGAGVALPRNNYVQTQQSADLTDAFVTAVENIQPVVDVREVTRVQNRVKTIQNLGSYKL